MTLRRMEVSDFRCLSSAELSFDPTFTFISGPNASGKTSVLEAIYLLSRGRSFRTRRLETLIRRGASGFLIIGEAEIQGRGIRLGVEGSDRGVRAKLAGEHPASLAELAAVLPVQIIDPEVHHLIEEGPSRRRRFLDWGVFHVEHGFVDQWQRYQKTLKQRNAALRAGAARSVICAWDPELVRLGEAIQAARLRYLETLQPIAIEIARQLLGLELELSLRAGWPRDESLAQALADSAAKEQESGGTQVGPHRAELAIRLNGSPVKDRISRGQQKLLAAALLMAQLRCFPVQNEARPTLLLDDPAAELDSERLLELIQEVGRHAVQLVVTSLQKDFQGFGSPGRRYSVEAGRLTEL